MFKHLMHINKTSNILYFRTFHQTKFNLQTHYETLNLKPDCSTKDIRSSFLKLSKEYHPDRNQDKEDTHKKFIKISQAYNILSKPDSRRDYDLGLAYPNRTDSDPKVHYTKPGVWSDESIWEYRDKAKDGFYQSQPYYGIKGVKKISNFWIVILCLAITSLGVTIQALAIKNSFTLKRDAMDQKSSELEKLHLSIRAKALENGNEKQIEILKALNSQGKVNR